MLILLSWSLSAVEKSDYCVDAALSDLSPSSVKVGKNFTMGILIDNCGDKVSEEVIFEITEVSPFMIIKEPLVKSIGKMGYSNSDRFLLYRVEVSNDASPGDYLIRHKLSYGTKDLIFKKYGSILITVIGDEAELSIASLKTKPVLPKEGETVELTMRIENTGDGTAKSVEVYIDHTFQGLKQSFIGALDSDEDGPAVFTFIADRSGEFEFPLVINYHDDFGDHEIKTNVDMTVLENTSNLQVIIGAAIAGVIIISLIFYFIKTKKSKDKIIQQLLKGNHSEEKHKRSRRKRKKCLKMLKLDFLAQKVL